nr:MULTISPECIES: acyltransferase [Clostridia]
MLRIISMILIVMHHFSVHGGFDFTESGITFNRIWVQILSGGGRLGVDLFILISGYFLVNSECKPKKLLKLVLQVTEYAAFCTVLLVLTGEIQVNSVTDAIQLAKTALLPIPFGEYWFATTYFLLYLFSPYLNCLIKSMGKRMHFKFVVTGLIVWCIFPSFTGASFSFNYLAWFIVLYFIAAYIKLYPVQMESKRIWIRLCAAGSFVLLLVLIIVVDLLSTRYPFFRGMVENVREMNRAVTVVCAVLMFLAFQTLHIQSKFINRVAATTFGIYLFHDNPQIRNLLWIKIFHGNTHSGSPYFILYSAAVIAAVFCVGSIIEAVRLYLSKVIRQFYSRLSLKSE